MSAPVTINLHRGLLSIGRHLAARVPQGLEVWERGLGALAAKALEQSTIPAGEIPLEQFVERALEPPKRRRR